MPKESLTDNRIRAVKPPAQGILELWDTKCSGLCLRVMPSARKSWTFRFRPQSSASFKRMTLGTYPALGLSDARSRAERIRIEVKDGSDPQHLAKQKALAARQAEARQKLTFDVLADDYLVRYAQRHKASWKSDAGYLARDVSPVWGDTPISAIETQEIRLLLSRIKDRAPVSANRTRSVLAKLFAWAVDEGLLIENPMVGVKKPHAEDRGRSRILTDPELRIIWSGFSEGALTSTGAAMRVLILLGQRPGEIAGMHRSELVDLDAPLEARWELPSSRMKGRRPHVVPLPPLAASLIMTQLEAAHSPDGFVFASKYSEKQRLARHTLSQALRRMIDGLSTKGPAPEGVQTLRETRPTPHDLRRTVATRLAQLGIPREDRLALLAHTWGDVHEAHYDRYERLKEKRKALLVWESHVAKVVGLKFGEQ